MTEPELHRLIESTSALLTTTEPIAISRWHLSKLHEAAILLRDTLEAHR